VEHKHWKTNLTE